MGDSSTLNAGSSTTSLNCRVRYCTFKGKSMEGLWDHLQVHHGVEAVEGSSGSFRVQWCNSVTTKMFGARVVGLLTYSGRRIQVWILDEPSEVHVYAREVRNSAPSASLPLSLELSSEQSGTASMVKFTGQDGSLTVSRQTVLDNLCQKSNGKLEAWISIQIHHDQLLVQSTTPTCQEDGIAEMSAPKLDNSVLHSSRVSAGASPESLAFSPISISQTGNPDALGAEDDSTEDISMVTMVEASPGGLFDVSQPSLQDLTAVEESSKTFIVGNSCPVVDSPQAVPSLRHAGHITAKVQPSSRLPKPNWRY